MNRRASLRRLLGRSAIVGNEQRAPQRTENTTFAPKPPGAGLTPYSGEWTFEQAAHLLRRTTFGPSRELISTAVEMGQSAVFDQLFADPPAPAPPVNPDFTEDPNVPVGQTWVDAPYSENIDLRPYRNRSLRSWIFLNMLEEGISIRQKMTLFWINHFGVAGINDKRFMYRYIELLRSSALGNFRQLIKDVTVDGSMLIFLNGNQNTEVAPNENYARELLELYTVGKGDLAGEGDYSTFTEQDVAAMARVLTGWRTFGNLNSEPENPPRVEYREFRHDNGTKQLSHRFGNAVISDLGDAEYAHLIDVIFQQDRVAHFICRKLYQWFVYYEIDEQTEMEVIAPLAQMLIDNDYELEPIVRTLLTSEHFFDILSVGPMIKNPIDYSLSMVKQLEMSLPDDQATRYEIGLRLYRLAGAMEMEYMDVPQVSGWKAYFQAPQFYRFWINASTLQIRSGLANIIAAGPMMINGFAFAYDPLAFIATMSNPTDPNVVIDEFSRLLHPQPLTDQQKVALKDILIPGLPDFEWTLEYGEYVADPENPELANAVSLKLRQLTRALISLAEFHLS
ncbi:DUF1800 domain-containing protein [Flavilitoribacter nigricans]|nr:DUF1800 domain-containing protein [Flavilitoribacter nigricans]